NLGSLEDGVTYYIKMATPGSPTFTLASVRGGPDLVLPRRNLEAFHYLGVEGIDLKAAPGMHDVYLDLNSDPKVGIHRLTDTNGQSLSITFPPKNDGQSSAIVKGGGGAILGTVLVPTAYVNQVANINAYVGKQTTIEALGTAAGNPSTGVPDTGDVR